MPCGSVDRSVGLSLCGTGQAAVICAHNGVMLQQAFSCYIHIHGNDYMTWDTGHLILERHRVIRPNPR